MLDYLKIRNFQNHESLVLRLDPHITTIVGKSDQGKSAVLRALKWLSTNKPSGDFFIRHGTDQTKVLLKIDNRKILRTKGKENAYYLDGKKFVALGQSGLPDEIASLLNLSETNFQTQHSAPYWLAQTPGQVSKELNSIIDLEVIDKSLANVAGMVRKAKTEELVIEDRLVEARGKVKELSWVVKLDRELQVLETKEKVLQSITNKRQSLSRLIEEGDRANDTVRTSLERCQELQGLSQKAGRLVETGAKIRKLGELLTGIYKWEKESCRAKQEAEKAQKELQKQMGGMCPLCGAKGKFSLEH